MGKYHSSTGSSIHFSKIASIGTTIKVRKNFDNILS